MKQIVDCVTAELEQHGEAVILLDLDAAPFANERSRGQGIARAAARRLGFADAYTTQREGAELWVYIG